jgi:hypothetical protein
MLSMFLDLVMHVPRKCGGWHKACCQHQEPKRCIHCGDGVFDLDVQQSNEASLCRIVNSHGAALLLEPLSSLLLYSLGHSTVCSAAVLMLMLLMATL